MQDPFSPPRPPSGLDETDCLPRLLLEPTMSRSGMFDGAWWPRSRDVMAELPDLIMALGAYLGHIPRVALDTSAWDTVPRLVTVNGCAVKIGRYATTTGTISLSRGMQDHFLLLVVPPDSGPRSAASAMEGAAATGNHTPAGELLVTSTEEYSLGPGWMSDLEATEATEATRAPERRPDADGS